MVPALLAWQWGVLMFLVGLAVGAVIFRERS